MCGIVGQCCYRSQVNTEWTSLALHEIGHRGPDGYGVWVNADNNVFLGHKRLAILDLSDMGSQPMLDSRKEIVIVFNGEIYNYRELKQELLQKGYSLQTNSDTEVIIYAFKEWREQAFNKLNGMFAMAVYDICNEELFLARDRVGEKPLFYRIDDNGLSFASEMKALLVNDDLPKKIDIEAMNCFLYEGYVPGDMNILDGYNKLMPGNYLKYDLKYNSFDIKHYWKLPTLSASATSVHVTSDELTDKLYNLLNDSIDRQLMADVEVGVLLSGGVDSSIVTAMAATIKPGLKTFTVRFPGHGKLDETEHARLIAKHFKTDHTELTAQSTSVDLLEKLAIQYDEPIIDSSMIPTYLVTQTIKDHCKVAIGGDGADELFGGYKHYNNLKRIEAIASIVPHTLRVAASRVAGQFLKTGYKGKNWLQALAYKKGDCPLVAVYYDKMDRRRLLGAATDFPEHSWLQRNVKGLDIIDSATRTDFSNYLPGDILVKVDRASMLNSLEVRAPFLDYRIIEFAYGEVPSSFKADKEQRKIILKNIARRILPNEFEVARKQGFSIPLDEWLKTKEWFGFFEDVLLDSQQTIFSKKTIKQLLEDQRKGYANSERLFGLVMFELWRKHYKVSV